MADRRRPRVLLALLTLLALTLVTLDFREGGQGPLSSLQHAATGLFAPLQQLVADATAPIGDAVDGVRELRELRERNLALEQENEQLRQRRVAVADLERENAELRELVGMREREDFSTTAARVIARPPGASRWTVLLDTGAEDGVQPGMVVIDADGVVGQIMEVTDAHAKAQLAVSPNARYGVRLAEGGEEALLYGGGHNPMDMRIIEDTEAEIEEGAEVVTRTFEGTRIPDGLPVGTVAEGGSLDRTPSLPVRPAVDFSALDVVLIVLDVPEAPSAFDEDDAEDGAPPDPDDDPQQAQSSVRSGAPRRGPLRRGATRLPPAR